MRIVVYTRNVAYERGGREWDRANIERMGPLFVTMDDETELQRSKIRLVWLGGTIVVQTIPPEDRQGLPRRC